MMGHSRPMVKRFGVDLIPQKDDNLLGCLKMKRG